MNADAANTNTSTEQTHKRPFRLRKRVYVVTAILIGFCWYSTVEEGLGGLLTWFLGILLLRLCWEVAWQLVLKDVPFLTTARRVLFKWRGRGTTASQEASSRV